jgi:translation initiation factor IF-2
MNTSPVATVLVLRGRLGAGAHLISGTSHAKVRVMSDSTGATVKTALPGMAVTVSGWKTLPKAGDEVLQGTEAEIKKAITNRLRKAEIESSLADVEVINSSRRRERERRTQELEYGERDQSLIPPGDVGPSELRLIIKADVSGSAEAVVGALQGIGNKEAMTRIISSGVGDISESDVMMAKAVGGRILFVIFGLPCSLDVKVQLLVSQSQPHGRSRVWLPKMKFRYAYRTSYTGSWTTSRAV